MLEVLKTLLLLKLLVAKKQDAENNILLDDPFEISKQAMFKYEMGEVSKALKTFSDAYEKYNEVEMFQANYLALLLKTGQYLAILELKNIQDKKNLEIVGLAKKCLKILESGDEDEIAKLIDISPDSLEANEAIINRYLKQGEAIKSNPYLLRLESIYPNNIDVLSLRIKVSISIGNINKAIEVLKKVDTKIYNNATHINSTLESILKISDVDHKLSRLVNVYRELYDFSSNSPDKFGIYSYFYKYSLKRLVEIGCDNFKSVESFAKLLLKIDKDEFSIYYYIKALIVDKKIKQANDEIVNYSNELGTSAKNSLQMFIQQVQKRIQEEEKAKEEERRRREQREKDQRQRMYERSATNKAGQDFLKYYEILGVKKNVSDEELKKSHRKKVREATKKAAKNKKLTQEQKDSEVKLLNKAYQILSDPEKRKMYDLGIDPEKGPQQGGYYNQGGGHGSYFDEDQINEIFQNFFGGGGGRGRRTQYVFL